MSVRKVSRREFLPGAALAAAAVALAGCGATPTPTPVPAKAPEAATVFSAALPPEGTAYSMLRVKVADYASWRPNFDNSEANRVANGATGAKLIFGDLDDPTIVIHIIEWKNDKGPRDWYVSPTLKDAQKTATVSNVQDMRFLRRV